MNQDSTYKVNNDYKGQKSILVPTRMYSRNSILGAMHIKSDKYLGVNLDRYVLTFHSDKENISKNADHEIAFNHIKSLEADVTHADNGKYYLKVHTDEGDLRFKFNNARDFHNVVEALRNTIHNDKPFYNASEGYNKESKKYHETPALASRGLNKTEISSDEDKDYQNHGERKKDFAKMQGDADHDYQKDSIKNNYGAFDDQKKREGDAVKHQFDNAKDYNKDLKSDHIERQKEIHDANKDFIKDNKYDASYDKSANRDQFKDNKDAIKQGFSADKDRIKQDYKENKDLNKDAAKDQYRNDMHAAKDSKNVNLDQNKDQYKANKDGIHHVEKVDENRADYAHDRNDAAYRDTKDGVKQDYNQAQDNLKADYNQYRDGNQAQRDNAKDNKNADFKQAKDQHKSDTYNANNIKDNKY